MKKTPLKTKNRLPAVRKTKALTVRRGGQALAVKKRKRHPNRPLTEAQIRLLLNAIDDIRDDALIRLGLSVGLRVSEVVGIRTSEIDFERGLIKIWDEKKDVWRFIMPTNEALSSIRKYLNALDKEPKTLFPTWRAGMSLSSPAPQKCSAAFETLCGPACSIGALEGASCIRRSG